MSHYKFFLFLFTTLYIQIINNAQEPIATQDASITNEQQTIVQKKPIGNRIQNAFVTAKTYVNENVQKLTKKVQKLVDKIPKQDPESKIFVIQNHNRIKRWMFNKNFRADKSKKDILYHTFHPIANYFIERYGKQTEYTAGKFQGIKYSLNGKIHYPNGTIKNVVFSITKDHNGDWYHREIKFHTKKKLHISSDTFVPKIKRYKFGKRGAVRDIIYFENSSWIKIYDAANDVTLFLRKNTEDSY